MFRPWVLVHRYRSSSDGLQALPNVSTLKHDILQLAGQQWWPVYYSTDTDFQHRSSRRCHILQDDRSAASPSLLVFVLRVLPDIPSRMSSLHTDCAGNPLQSTSTGNSHTLHPLSLQFAIRSAYFRFFLSCASSQFSSHGTISCIATNVFDCWDTSTASGLRVVSTMLGKTSLLSRSTLSSQSCPLSSTAFCLGGLLLAVASPCLTN